MIKQTAIFSLLTSVVTYSFSTADENMRSDSADQNHTVVPSWANHDPAAAIVSRVQAQAALMEAQRKGVTGFHILKKINSINTMHVDIEENDLRQIRNLRHISRQAARNHRTWLQLRDNPDVSEASIRSGRALNFLLTRLAVSALPYRFDPDDTRYSSGALSQLKMEPDVFEQLTLQHRKIDFPATSLTTADISYWPYILRWDEFKALRSDYERARSLVVEEAQASGEASVRAVMAMQKSLDTLSNAFRKSSTARAWALNNGRYVQYGRCQDFFLDLNREMKRLEETGDLRPFKSRDGYTPGEDGDHLVSFLSFMNRNGLQFSRAKPGSEPAHHSLFVLMRALYLTVEDADESIRLQSIQGRANEAMLRESIISPQKERLLPQDEQ